jgi:hypothetical protein
MQHAKGWNQVTEWLHEASILHMSQDVFDSEQSIFIADSSTNFTSDFIRLGFISTYISWSICLSNSVFHTLRRYQPGEWLGGPQTRSGRDTTVFSLTEQFVPFFPRLREDTEFKINKGSMRFTESSAQTFYKATLNVLYSRNRAYLLTDVNLFYYSHC